MLKVEESWETFQPFMTLFVFHTLIYITCVWLFYIIVCMWKKHSKRFMIKSFNDIKKWIKQKRISRVK